MSRLRRSNSAITLTGNATLTPTKSSVPVVYLDTDLVGNVRRPRVAVTFATLVKLFDQFFKTYPGKFNYAALMPLLRLMPKRNTVGFNATHSFFLKDEKGLYQLFVRQREYSVEGIRSALSSTAGALPDESVSRQFVALKYADGAFVENTYGDSVQRSRNRRTPRRDVSSSGVYKPELYRP